MNLELGGIKKLIMLQNLYHGTTKYHDITIPLLYTYSAMPLKCSSLC